jgi:hypothetical protein
MIGGRGRRALGPLCVSIARPCALWSAHPAQSFPAPRGPPLLSQARERPQAMMHAEMTASLQALIDKPCS